MTNTPLVSVVIICYNQEDFIREAVESVLSQTYQNLQIVISDDASIDRTRHILREYAEKDKRIDLILQPHNVGITQNTNAALRQCKGDFVAFMGGDDILLPDKIEKQVEYMLAHPEVAISYHDLEVFDSETQRILYYWSERYGKKEGDVQSVIAYGPYMGALSVMTRREFLPLEGVNPDMVTVSDWYLWVYILAKSQGKTGYIDAVLARYRRHVNNVTTNWQHKLQDEYRVIEVFEQEFSEYRTAIARRKAEIFFMESILLFRQKKFRKAVQQLRRSVISFSPFYCCPWVRLIVREVKFIIRHFQKDDLLLSLFQGNVHK